MRSLEFILLLWDLFSTGQPAGTSHSATTLTASRKLPDNVASCLCQGEDDQLLATCDWLKASLTVCLS